MRFASLLVSLVILGSIALVSAKTTTATAATSTTTATRTAAGTYTPLISTRANFDTSTSLLLPNHKKTDYAATDVPGLQVGECPAEIVIFVHGVGATQSDAIEQTERVKVSLNNNGYYNPVIGFSWDSNTHSTDISLIAQQQGPKFAHFILDFKNKCPDSNVRIIGHSMGGRVTLSTLASLHKNKEWKSKNFKLASVDLMGAVAASSWNVDGIKSPVRNIIEQVVIKFYNLVDPKDKLFSGTDPRMEDHTALGNTESQKGISLPSNYIQQDVQNEILPLCDANADGKPDFGLTSKDCNAMERGFNHMGYMGFRDPTTKKLMDDGAMNVVVDDWKDETK